MDSEANNNSANKEQKTTLKYQSFDISIKEKIFSIEISTVEKEEAESILIKGYEKSNVSKFIYSNSFNSKKLLEMSKAFKICDGFSEIYTMILQKFQDNEVQLSLKDDLYINFEFTLPNKKTDKISLVLQKGKIKETELIEKLFENISFLHEKNKALQDQITKLASKKKQKKQKSFIDILSKKFKESDITLLNDLYSSLKNFDLEYEYLKEIMNQFQKKTNTIYNFKKDECTIQGIITKVFGKNNLAGHISFFYKEKGQYSFESDFA